MGKNLRKNKKSFEIQTAKPMKLPTVRKLHFKISHIVLAIIILLLAGFFIRVAIWEHNYLERMEGSERATAPMVSVEDGEEVEDTPPTSTEVAEYVVAPDKPRYFSIPSLGINNARIVEIGLRSNGELSTPYNIYDVGWYNASALPGTNKVAVMDGHSGSNGIGVFGKLPRIESGAIITVEMGDSRLYTYRVVDTTTKKVGSEANDYMAEVFSTPELGKGSLSLITCTGDYLLTQKTFSHRFFLRAVLEDSTPVD